MNNFLKFIEEDVEAKKTLISTLPVNTKPQIRKYNEKISIISEKYKEYKASVKKYIETKSKSFNIKKNKNIEEITKEVNNLEHIRFILNPLNTYYEKMGFDNLLYQMNNYYDFNFNSLNDIIKGFLDKFEIAGIYLNKEDFNYTCYVNEYMSVFLEIRNKKEKNYNSISETFEKIYWINPEIIEHIELNFRKLIKKHEKEFINYVLKIQKETMIKDKINSYEDCLNKLKAAHLKLSIADKENISDIIELAKNGILDINNYFEDSKVRTSAYTSMMIDASYLNDKDVMNRFYENIEKLKINLEEYANYLKFLPLINYFKNEYGKLSSNLEKNSNKVLKDVESEINSKESKLDKLNRKIFSNRFGFLDFKKGDIKELKTESVKLAKELYEIYKTYEKEFFKEKVMTVLSSTMTISELLNLYYSYDYFKKKAIKKVFEITNYEKIIEYSDEFDLFAINPTNIVTKGMNLFEENNISRVIANKYRLYNINLNEDTMGIDDISAIIEKIEFLLRIKEIENSETTVEKIWFMVQVNKITNSDKK